MKKLLLLTLSAGLLLTGCYKKEIEANLASIEDLEQSLSVANEALRIAFANLEAADAVIAANVTANTNAIDANSDATDAAIAAVNAEITEVEGDIAAIEAQIASLQQAAASQNSVDGALARAIAALQGDVSDLEDDLDDLDDRVDVLEALGVTHGNWTPLFATQTANFTQTGDSFFNGDLLSEDTVTRTVVVATTSNTVELRSTEALLFATGVSSATADIDGDNRHDSDIFRYRTDAVYTGTVSGSTIVLGSHTVTGTLSPWVVTRLTN